MRWIDWYNAIAKPIWTPAPSTIGLIRSILCPGIGLSFWFVLAQALRKKVRCS
jgi:benzodiazapine receptor